MIHRRPPSRSMTCGGNLVGQGGRMYGGMYGVMRMQQRFGDGDASKGAGMHKQFDRR